MSAALEAAKQAFADAMKGAAWYLNKRTYPTSASIKRYAVASAPFSVSPSVVFPTIPVACTHAHLLLGSEILETIEFPAPANPADAPLTIMAGYWYDPAPIALTDEDMLQLDQAVVTLQKIKNLLEPSGG